MKCVSMAIGVQQSVANVQMRQNSYSFEIGGDDDAPTDPKKKGKMSSSMPAQEVRGTLLDALEAIAANSGKDGSQLSTERCLKITFYPLAKFRVRAVTRCSTTMEGHSEAVLCAAFSPDSKQLATGSGDCTVCAPLEMIIGDVSDFMQSILTRVLLAVVKSLELTW